MRYHLLWTLPPTCIKQQKYIYITSIFLLFILEKQLLQYTSVSMGNRFLSEQGIFTDTSSQASLKLLGCETGTSPSLRRSVCKQKTRGGLYMLLSQVKTPLK